MPVAAPPGSSHQVRAHLLRKVSGSTSLDRTMRRAVRVLAEPDIPSLVVGGYAVQENGYARFTSAVDILLPNVAAARAVFTVTGRISKVEVDLLPGSGSGRTG